MNRRRILDTCPFRLCPVDEQAVGAAQVLYPPLAILEDNLGVLAADHAGLDLDLALRSTTDAERLGKQPIRPRRVSFVQVNLDARTRFFLLRFRPERTHAGLRVT